MVVNKKKKFNLNDKGQAFFEMIMFIPFMLFLFTMIITFGNAVNGAINQNKVLRGFFYASTRNNSYGLTQGTLVALQNAGISTAGIHSLGWASTREGNNSYSSCYPVKRFFGGVKDEECTDAINGADTTSFIRVYTIYGVCGANWRFDNTNFRDEDFQANTLSACRNQ